MRAIGTPTGCAAVALGGYLFHGGSAWWLLLIAGGSLLIGLAAGGKS